MENKKNNNIGERLKKLRKDKKLTMDELSKIFNDNFGMNVNKSMISKWENNAIVISNNNANAYCKYFNVQLDYLIYGKNTPPLPIKKQNDIFSELTAEELVKLEKFNNMSTVMFMNEGNTISDNDKETLAIAYAEVLISQRKK